MPVEDRVRQSIEHDRPYPMLQACGEIDGGSGFDPFPLDVELSVTVIRKHVCLHEARNPFRQQVVADNCKSQSCRDTCRPTKGGKQYRFLDAKPLSSCQGLTGAEMIQQIPREVRVVNDPIPDEVKQSNSSFSLVNAAPPQTESKLL